MVKKWYTSSLFSFYILFFNILYNEKKKKSCRIVNFSKSNFHLLSRRIYFLHTFTWVCNCFGIFFILAAHEHYSIGIYIYIYILFVCLSVSALAYSEWWLIAWSLVCLFVCLFVSVKGWTDLVQRVRWRCPFWWGGGSLPSFLVHIFQFFGCTPN